MKYVLSVVAIIFLSALSGVAQTSKNPSSVTLVYGTGFQVSLPVDEGCLDPRITISVEEPAIASELMKLPAILDYLQAEYRLMRLLVN